MTFKEHAKIALAKVLSDLIQSDGIVNQGEINYLKQVFKVLKIHDSHLKAAGTLSLADATRILSGCGDAEKSLLLHLVQQLAGADGDCAPCESFLSTAIVLAIGLERKETHGLHAEIVSLPNPLFDPHDTVLFVEPETLSNDAQGLTQQQYEAISLLLRQRGKQFFFLPRIMADVQEKKSTFLQMLRYLEPLLTEDQLQLIGHDLSGFRNSDLSKEIFLNYLDVRGFHITHPAFLIKIGKARMDVGQDFLLLEVLGNPFHTLKRFYSLTDKIMRLPIPVLGKNHQRYLDLLTMPKEALGSDAFQYTGFHKIIVDTLLKYHSGQGLSRLRISDSGQLFLVDRNDAEVKIQTLGRALYILFLRHEEGITLTELADHREELMEIYAGISTYGDEGKLRQTVDKLVDFVGSTMNPLISRIRKSFTALLGAQAKDYLIEGDAGERKKIHLDRRLVIDEFRS